MRSRSESPPPGSIFAKKARQDEGKDNGNGNTDNGNTNKERAKMRPRFMLSAKQHEQLSNMKKVQGNGKGNTSKVKSAGNPNRTQVPPSPQTPFVEVFDVENGEEMADLHAWGPDYPARRDREQVYIFG